ncbi:MAG: proline racemase family protein [Anaerolineales bacterium]|nr:proline racemase family protein [Anaerolineales bacterium]
MPEFQKLISAIDSHTAGESTRLVISGLPPICGQTMLEKMAYAQNHLGWLPGYLLLEPRGHKDLYGAILVDPCNPKADWGVLFMNNQGYETMCGHGLIGVATCLLETGMISMHQPTTQLNLDTPAGLVSVWAKVEGGQVQEITFENVPAFVYQQDVRLDLSDGQSITLDVVFGGNFFAMVHTQQLGIELTLENTYRLASLGMDIRQTVNTHLSIHHPELSVIDHVTDVRFYHEIDSEGVDSRNVVILGNRMIDRSPCGTGTCAELALRYARGELKAGESWVCESILGTRFIGHIAGEAQVGAPPQRFNAIIPKISGRAFLTGWRLFNCHPDDPFPQGFLIP